LHYKELDREALVASLLRGFAQHRRQPNLPDDHWLPQEAYDEAQWEPQDVWMFVITDGSIRPHLCEHRDPAAAARRSQAAGGDDPLDALLQEAGVAAVQPKLAAAATTLSDLSAALGAGRPALLARLQALGLTLPERQRVANVLSRATREGRHGL